MKERFFLDFNFYHNELEQIVKKSQEKEKVLVAEIKQKHKDVRNKQKEEISICDDRLVNLEMKISKLHEAINQAELKRTTLEGRIQNIELVLDKERINILEMTQEQKLLQQRLTSLLGAIKEQEKFISNIHQKNESVLQRATKQLEFYNRNLGLQIIPTKHGTLAIVFTQISRKDPGKEYIIELTMNEKTYKLHRAVPLIENLLLLQERLNETNDFSGFLIAIRSLFSKQ